jgi:hypothetical protein
MSVAIARAAKRYLTYDSDTDPTGRFMRSLLIDEAGIGQPSFCRCITRAFSDVSIVQTRINAATCARFERIWVGDARVRG